MSKRGQIGDVVRVEDLSYIHHGKFGFIEMCNNSQLWALVTFGNYDDILASVGQHCGHGHE